MEKNVSKPMHVLMTADTIGGVWTYSLQLIKAMENYNIKYTLVTMGAKCTDVQKADASAIKNLEIIESSYKLEWMDEPWQEVDLAGKWLVRLENNLKPDIVHLNSFAFGNLNFNAPKIVVGHSCIYSWWNAVKNEEAPEYFSEYYSRVKKGLSQADWVVAPSHNMMESLNKHYGRFKAKTVVPNALDASSFHKGEKRPFIFSMGRLWDEAKNIKLLESVSDKLLWPTFIAGDNQEPNGISEMKMSESKACFLGLLSSKEISYHLAKASVFVLPAKYEPFGLSVLEAALSGCVLVLGDIPSLRENWDNAAVFVSPDDPDELKDVINALITHPSQREKLAMQALKRASEFSTQKMASGYFTIYESLVNSTLLSDTGLYTSEEKEKNMSGEKLKY